MGFQSVAHFVGSFPRDDAVVFPGLFYTYLS